MNREGCIDGRGHPFRRVFAVGILLTAPWSIAAAQEPSIPFEIAGNAIHGELRPSDFSVLSAEIAASILDIAVRDGERFKKGQVIVRLDCALLKAQLEQAEAVNMAAAKKYLTEKRLNELHSTGKLEMEISAAEAAKAEAEAKAARVRVSKCDIVAPYDGRAVSLKARPHQFAQVGMPILEILSESNLEIEFIIPSSRLLEFEISSPFSFRVNETGQTYKATVLRRGAQIDPVSQSIQIVGRIVNEDKDLIPGMTGSVLTEPE